MGDDLVINCLDSFEVCSFKTRKSQGLSLSWNSNQLTTWAHKCQFDCLRADIKHKILTQASDDGGGQCSGSSAAAAAAAAAQRKMDKTTVLLATIDFLKKHNEAAKNPAGTNSEQNTHRFVIFKDLIFVVYNLHMYSSGPNKHILAYLQKIIQPTCVFLRNKIWFCPQNIPFQL